MFIKKKKALKIIYTLIISLRKKKRRDSMKFLLNLFLAGIGIFWLLNGKMELGILFMMWSALSMEIQILRD